MKKHFQIWLLWVISLTVIPACFSQNLKKIRFDFYGDTIELPFDSASFVDFNDSLSDQSIQSFYENISKSHFEPVITSLLKFKEQHRPDDWLYYQLIRRTAQSISPKADNYQRYTLYKWFFLSKSGYDALITIKDDKILFYIQSDELIYNIPYRIKNGKQYVCLNYHDYGFIDFTKNTFSEVVINVPEARNAFSYKITRMPEFKLKDYVQKDLSFEYADIIYHFNVMLEPEVKSIFANYPVLDYNYYFNIPLSKETYNSLIPELKNKVRGMSTKDGVGFLMRFTRYTFLFKKDNDVFGKEKRMSPEETLLYDGSDCEDRAALFFYLVKEIYGLPMIVLSYPLHVTVAVEFDKPIGNTITYNNKKYSVCEPTPQRKDLPVGKLLPTLKNEPYEVVYEYTPKNAIAGNIIHPK